MMTLNVKIMDNATDLADSDKRKGYTIYSNVAQIRCENGESAHVMLYFADAPALRLDVAGDVYVMNEQGKTISTFVPAQQLQRASNADRLREEMSSAEQVRGRIATAQSEAGAEQRTGAEVAKDLRMESYWKSECSKIDERYNRLCSVVKTLYYAGYWKSDRLTPDEETRLWTMVRDAARFEPGSTEIILGAPRWPVDTSAVSHIEQPTAEPTEAERAARIWDGGSRVRYDAEPSVPVKRVLGAWTAQASGDSEAVAAHKTMANTPLNVSEEVDDDLVARSDEPAAHVQAPFGPRTWHAQHLVNFGYHTHDKPHGMMNLDTREAAIQHEEDHPAMRPERDVAAPPANPEAPF